MKKLSLIAFLLVPFGLLAQNSFVGDGFGGRSWYIPSNFEVGPYTAYAFCGDSLELFSWGANYNGVMGDTNLTGYGSSSPKLIEAMNGVKQFSTGYVSGAIRYDYSGWIWGGSLSSTPIKVLDSVHSVDAGQSNIVFVKKDGTVWVIGSNYTGRFGTGKRTNEYSNVPIQMPGINNAVRAVDGGGLTSVLLDDGTIKVAGCGYAFGAKEDSIYPECLPRLISLPVPIVEIKANKNSSIALDTAGNIFSYVLDFDNQIKNLGQIAGLSNIISISGTNDGEHFLALDEDSNCYSWGRNRFGQLGNGNIRTDYNEDPITLVGTGIVDILAGETFSYLITGDGEILATGSSYYGYGSIWMNKKDTVRTSFIEIDPTKNPMNLCSPRIRTWRDQRDTLCEGDTLFTYNHTITKSGNYFDIISDTALKDSIISYIVHFKQNSYATIDTSICIGKSIFVNNKSYSNPGFYLDTTTNVIGCDSIISLTVRILQSSSYSDTITLCSGDSFVVGNKAYTEDGLYFDTLTNQSGCDSFIHINLDVRSFLETDVQTTICYGDSIQIGNSIYYESGAFIDSLFSEEGCDSIVKLVLEVRSEILEYDSPIICPDDSIRIGSAFYSIPGTYIDSLVSQSGCDSVRVISLDTFIDQTCLKPTVYIPNTFTPNKDPINYLFRPIGINITEVHLEIYSRWGEKLYDKTSQNAAWDGLYLNKPCQQGVYIYKIEVNTTTLDPQHFKGVVTLLR